MEGSFIDTKTTLTPNMIDNDIPSDSLELTPRTITHTKVTNLIEHYIPMRDPMGTSFPQEHVSQIARLKGQPKNKWS